jgi:hypothetical protein
MHYLEQQKDVQTLAILGYMLGMAVEVSDPLTLVTSNITMEPDNPETIGIQTRKLPHRILPAVHSKTNFT